MEHSNGIFFRKSLGVGELKLLRHKVNHTYRLVMRREQVHKLVLNHGIGSEFNFTPFNNNMRSFNWRTLNFAESNEGILESLAVRFKKEELAQKFKKALNYAIRQSQSRETNAQANEQEDASLEVENGN